jgi:acetyl esterase/lipase
MSKKDQGVLDFNGCPRLQDFIYTGAINIRNTGRNMLTRTLLCLMLASMTATGSEKLHDSSVLLWPGGAPEAKGSEITDKPRLTIHLPAEDESTGAAIVVYPGGGFSKLASDSEGLHVARWLNSMGVAAFVLRYRLRPDYEPSIALLDAQRAIRLVRQGAKEYAIDPDRIGILGFSAGGHLATSAAIKYDAGDSDAADPIERESSRPNFIVPIYPAIDEAPPKQVTPETPAAFLVATHEDLAPRIKGTLPFYEALLDNGVPAEMHVFARGKHGAGLAPGDPSMGQWPGLVESWLRSSGFLTGQERISVSGIVTIDGKPMPWGAVAFIPEDPSAPRAWTFSSGKFSIDAADGPVPGSYRIEVHVLSRDLSGMKSGNYTMDGPEHYTRASPTSNEPIVVEIRPNEEINIAITTR